MLILNIIAAPVPRMAIIYNPLIDKVTAELADVIGLIEITNPEDGNEIGTLPVYMTSDSFGVYSPPQFNVGFLDFQPVGEELDLDKYDAQVTEIKKFFEDAKLGMVEVETKGNLSQIKRPFKHIKKDEPKDDA